MSWSPLFSSSDTLLRSFCDRFKNLILVSVLQKNRFYIFACFCQSYPLLWHSPFHSKGENWHPQRQCGISLKHRDFSHETLQWELRVVRQITTCQDFHKLIENHTFNLSNCFCSFDSLYLFVLVCRWVCLSGQRLGFLLLLCASASSLWSAGLTLSPAQ